MKKLHTKKKTTTVSDPNYQKHGETSSNHRQQQGTPLKGRALTAWCNRQRKELVEISQHRGTNTAKLAVNSEPSSIEKSVSAIMSGRHYFHRRKKQQQQQQLGQDNFCNDDDDDDDDDFFDVEDHQEVDDIGNKDDQKELSQHLPPTSLSTSEPVLTTIKHDEVKFGSRVALLERAVELGWIKKVFGRHRSTEDPAVSTKTEIETTVIPPADFPNEGTKSIHALVDQYHSDDSTVIVNTNKIDEKTEVESVEEQKYAHLPIFQCFYNFPATPGDTVEEPPDANPEDFSAYCDKILFGRYT
ncbi:hypothetical protein INT45_003854 [Circinella minor]|uniref:Uncharacterized protein n=1 Tax=Circinella minor TaxID=1195481 RepID=A0A8H7VU34_9FUNG|nr:hypothetical protein INT45_003854 [Circinella minor]